MSMEGDIKGYLQTYGDITALLSNPNAQICLQAVPEGTDWPNARIFKVSGVRGAMLSGADGTVESRIQVDCRGTSVDSAKSLFTAVRMALEDDLPGDTIGSTEIMSVIIENEHDGEEYLPDGADSPIFVTSADAMILYKELVP